MKPFHSALMTPRRLKNVSLTFFNSFRKLVTITAITFLAFLAFTTHLGCNPTSPTTNDPQDAAVSVDAETDGSGLDGNIQDGAHLADSSMDSGDHHDSEVTADSGVDPDGAGPDAAPLVDDGLPDMSWYEQGEKASDRTSLNQSFSSNGYTPPSGSYVMAAEILDGVNQPAFRFYTWYDTGFTYSTGNFWPASTIKLTAAVGALRTLGDYGLSGAATVTFTDDDGSYNGTVEGLYDPALRVSSNIAYNRLMLIAGFDEMNEDYLIEEEGLPHMVLQRRYTHPYPGSNLRTSPSINYSEGGLSGTIPQRVGTSQHPECPNEGNCTTLFEIMEVMRRVTLHDELTNEHQYPVESEDIQGIMSALLAANTTLQPGVSEALGDSVLIYNKTGFVPDNDRLDHGMILDDSTGNRYLIALSLPEPTTVAADLSDLAKHTIEAMMGGLSAAPPLQLTSGTNMTVQLDDNGPGSMPETRSYTIWIHAPGADSLELWFDRWPLPPPMIEGPYFKLDHDFSNSGERLMIVMAYSNNTLIGYRALTVYIN